MEPTPDRNVACAKSNAKSSRRAVSTCVARELESREHQSHASLNGALACFPFLSYGRAVGDESVSRNRSIMTPLRTNDFNQSDTKSEIRNCKDWKLRFEVGSMSSLCPCYCHEAQSTPCLHIKRSKSTKCVGFRCSVKAEKLVQSGKTTKCYQMLLHIYWHTEGRGGGINRWRKKNKRNEVHVSYRLAHFYCKKNTSWDVIVATEVGARRLLCTCWAQVRPHRVSLSHNRKPSTRWKRTTCPCRAEASWWMSFGTQTTSLTLS